MSSGQVVDANNVKHVVQEALTDKEKKKLYQDNCKSRNKLSLHVGKDLLEPMLMVGGPKQSVWLMKQWFEKNYGDARREDTLQDLIKQFNELHPGDFTEAMLYIGKVDSLNTHFMKIDARYQKTDLELIIAMLMKIPDNKDSKMSVWDPFQAEYLKEGMMANTTWMNFKQHLTRERKQVGSPSGGKPPVGKAVEHPNTWKQIQPIPMPLLSSEGTQSGKLS
jgi:predicted PolB exonuclease-like 3'-5' exonuclease